MRKTYQITIEGRKELEKELAELKGRRGEVAAKIAEARDFGDLSENAEQGIVETRIAEVEDILQNTEIIKSSKKSKIDLGSRVELKTGHKTVIYSVVGPVEADPLAGKISNQSPIGLALMGKKLGDKAMITTPKGDIEYEITHIA